MSSQLLDRKVAPAVRPIGDLVQLEPEELTLNYGTKAYILRSFDQEVIRLDLVFPAGHWQQPQFGVAYHTAKLLSEGTTSFSAKEIADRIAFYGASLQADPSSDRATITLLCLAKYFKEMLILVQELWQKPLFPEQELQHLKQRTIQHIKVERQKNNYLANEALNIHLFGPDHPYRGSLTVEEIQQINRDLIIGFHRNTFLNCKPAIFLTGSVTDNHIAILNEIIIDSPLSNLKPNTSKTIQINNGDEIELTGPNHIQAAIKLGSIHPGPNSSEYHKLIVFNEALGGYFGSRLMRNLREDKGYTYGIHSYVQVREHATVHMISTEVKADIAQLAIDEIKKEINLLTTTQLSTEELNSIKNSIIGKFASERATIFDSMDTIKFRTLNSLDKAFFKNLLLKVRNLEANDLQEYITKLQPLLAYSIIKVT